MNVDRKNGYFPNLHAELPTFRSPPDLPVRSVKQEQTSGSRATLRTFCHPARPLPSEGHDSGFPDLFGFCVFSPSLLVDSLVCAPAVEVNRNSV
jgi:hypothetical protein